MKFRFLHLEMEAGAKSSLWKMVKINSCRQGEPSLSGSSINPGVGMVCWGKSVETACKPGRVTHFLQPKVNFSAIASSKSGTSLLLA